MFDYLLNLGIEGAFVIFFFTILIPLFLTSLIGVIAILMKTPSIITNILIIICFLFLSLFNAYSIR